MKLEFEIFVLLIILNKKTPYLDKLALLFIKLHEFMDKFPIESNLRTPLSCFYIKLIEKFD